MSDDTVTALRRIEELETDLHTRDDPMADDVSDLRRIAARLLINEAYDDMVAQMDIKRCEQ